jgi:2-methylisocitrate lyase-like PEP mutase family enzyme
MKNRAVNTFRDLHTGQEVLILVNVWDAASASVLAGTGAKAIATSSAALCWAHGYQDGTGEFPDESMLPAIREIVDATNLPVTVDLEAGYSDDPQKVAERVLNLSTLGVAGINLEDGTDEPELLADKILSIRQRLGEKGADIFLNARTDTFLRPLVPPEEQLRVTIARGQLYTQAGADGFFVPRLSALDQMRTISEQLELPLNVLGFPEVPPLDVLRSHGVRRLSLGALPYEKVLGEFRKQATNALAHGHTPDLFVDAIPYAEMNAYFTFRRQK